MYHISADPRARKSAALIVQAVQSCAGMKKLEEITVSDLQRESSVSRSTFYRLFDNIVDVLEYQCDCIFRNLFEIAAAAQNTDPQDTFLMFIRAFMEESKFIELLSKHDHMEILWDCHRRNMPSIEAFFGINGVEDPWEADYVCSILSVLLPAVLSVWIRHGKQETAEELCRNMKNSFRILGAMVTNK